VRTTEGPLIDALQNTPRLTVVELEGVNHVLRDDASESIDNLTKTVPFPPTLVSKLDVFVTSSPYMAA